MNIKKVVAAALIVSSMTAVSASAAEFNDIKGHWAEDVINELADKDIIHGVSDTEFNPDGTVTDRKSTRLNSSHSTSSRMPSSA